MSGITPAYAGTTEANQAQQQQSEDHPRLRGNDVYLPRYVHLVRGSPPLTRERQ